MPRDGTIVMRAPGSAAMIGRNLASSAIFRKTSSYPSGSFESTAGIDGVKRLYLFQRVGEHPLILTSGSSLDAVYAGWH